MKKILQLLLILTSLIGIISCDVTSGEKNFISINYPPENAVIKDVFLVSGDCRYNKKITSVELELTNSETQKKYTFQCNDISDNAHWKIFLNVPEENGFPIEDGIYQLSATVKGFYKKTECASRIIQIDNSAPEISDINFNAENEEISISGKISQKNDLKNLNLQSFRNLKNTVQILSEIKLDKNEINSEESFLVARFYPKEVIDNESDSIIKQEFTRLSENYEKIYKNKNSEEVSFRLILSDDAKVYQNPDEVIAKNNESYITLKCAAKISEETEDNISEFQCKPIFYTNDGEILYATDKITQYQNQETTIYGFVNNCKDFNIFSDLSIPSVIEYSNQKPSDSQAENSHEFAKWLNNAKFTENKNEAVFWKATFKDNKISEGKLNYSVVDNSGKITKGVLTKISFMEKIEKENSGPKSLLKLLKIMAIAGIIIFIAYVIIKNKRAGGYYHDGGIRDTLIHSQILKIFGNGLVLVNEKRRNLVRSMGIGLCFTISALICGFLGLYVFDGKIAAYMLDISYIIFAISFIRSMKNMIILIISMGQMIKNFIKTRSLAQSIEINGETIKDLQDNNFWLKIPFLRSKYDEMYPDENAIIREFIDRAKSSILGIIAIFVFYLIITTFFAKKILLTSASDIDFPTYLFYPFKHFFTMLFG